MKDLEIRGAGDLLGGEQSGFINEIGFDTYQKIMNEAIEELKENEFRDLFAEENNRPDRAWTDDCVIDTDLEILIPSDYVDSITERLSLYKELDALGTNAELDDFTERLRDRFGPLPAPVEELVETMRMRIAAQQVGIEKIILKKQTLILQFTSKTDYYNSAVFGRVLGYLQTHKRGEMKQKNDKLNISFKPVHTVRESLEVLLDILGTEQDTQAV